MTQGSMLWTTSSVGDGAAAGYTQAQTMRLFAATLLADTTDEGVLKNYGNALAVTRTNNAVQPQAHVNTGGGWVKGLFYWNTASVDLNIALPVVGDTGFRVVLQATGSGTNTIRAAVVMNTDGTSAIPALTQDATFPDTAGDIWEIPLAQGVVDTSGDVWTDSGKTTGGVTDDRVYIHPSIEVETAMIGDDQVTAAKIDDGDVWFAGGQAQGATLVGGTTDDERVRIDANDERIGEFHPNGANAPNVRFGYKDNDWDTGAEGAFIGGGGEAGSLNTVTDSFGVVVGGKANQAGDNAGTTSDKPYATVCGGYSNTASGQGAGVLAGQSNTASGDGAGCLAGSSNNATGAGAATVGGTECDAEGDYSVAMGKQSQAELDGQVVVANGYYANDGDAQSIIALTLRRSVTHSDNAWYTLYLDGDSDELAVPADTCWTFDILIAGMTAGAGKSFAFRIEGLIENDGGNTSIKASTVTTIDDADDVSFDAQVTAGGAGSEVFNIQVQDTDGTGDVVRWVANLRAAVVQFAAP